MNDFNGSTTAETFVHTASSTSGVAVPANRRGKKVVTRLRHTATGARTATVRIYGYCPGEVDSDGAAVASTSGWVDTGEDITLASTAVDGSQADVFETLTVFTRLHGKITAVTGTSTTLGLAFAFTDEG